MRLMRLESRIEELYIDWLLMRRETIHYACNIVRLWMSSMAVLFATNANAVGIGGSQVNIGEPPKVQIVLVSAEQTEDSPRSAEAEPKREYPDSVAAPKSEETNPAAIKKPGVRRVSGKKKIKPSDKLSLSLLMTLSIPGNEPVRPGHSTKIGEALQQDSIAKEKTLSVLNAQIAEMEQMIKAQQSQLGVSTNPSNLRVAPSGVLAQSSAVGSLSGVSSVPGVGNEQPKPKIVAPALRQASKEENSRVELLEMSWIKPAIGLGLVLLAVPGFVWYRRYKAAQQWKRGSFHNLSDVHDPELVETPAIAQTALPVNEQTIKTPAYDEEKSQSILPPEYEMLEEADIYLRFGHDKLAEEVLREALKINPKNPQAYLKLLRIYFAREDSVAFLAVAQHLKSLGDGMAWVKAMEMGRNLDPNNALYS